LGTDSGTAYVLTDQGVQIVEVTIRAGQSIQRLSWSVGKLIGARATSTLTATFTDGAVHLMRAYDDVDPIIRQTQMKSNLVV
jgi:hypothetical protein